MATKKKSENGNGPNRALLAVLYTTALIAAAIGVLALSSYLLPQFDHGLRGGEPPQFPQDFGGPFPPDIGDYLLVRFALSAINLLLVIYLLFIHIRDYLKLKSSFTLGLVAFLFSFLLYSLATLPLVHLFIGSLGRAAFLSFVPMAFTTLGLLIFARLSGE